MVPFNPPDIVGGYAEQIRAHLSPTKGFTVAELSEAAKLSDESVRRGLDRLLFQKTVAVTIRHTAHRRGAMPREYWLAVSPSVP